MPTILFPRTEYLDTADEGRGLGLAATLSWTDPAYDSIMFDTTDQLGQTVGQVASARGGLLDFRFPNDANAKQDVFTGFGLSNKEKLREISLKYDPLQIFQKLQNGGFLVSGNTK